MRVWPVIRCSRSSMRSWSIVRAITQSGILPVGWALFIVCRRYRRYIVQTLELDLEEELNWARSFVASRPKNYQVWHHRSCLIELLNDPLDELDQMIKDFTLEPKNYHAWLYRQWLIQRFGGSLQDELKLVDELLRVDVYNNSAWNHRSYVFWRLGDKELSWLHGELQFARSKLLLDSANESTLQYIGWLQSLA